MKTFIGKNKDWNMTAPQDIWKVGAGAMPEWVAKRFTLRGGKWVGFSRGQVIVAKVGEQIELRKSGHLFVRKIKP